MSILAIDKAGKYGGKSALTHEFNGVNPVEYEKVVNKERISLMPITT